MRKLVVSIALVLTSLVTNAQVTKVITRVSEAGDVASFELDCVKSFPSLAKGLKYNITRHEFKGAEVKNTYHIMLVMDGFYTSTLNKEMTISAVFSDGTTVDNVKIIEKDGFFDGACTLVLNSPPAFATNLDLKLKEVIVYAEKKVVYKITEQKSNELKKNLQNIVNAK